MPGLETNESLTWRPPQFGLRSMFIAITALGIAFAIINAVGAAWGVLLGFLFCLIAAHMAGNALGTKLRDQANQQVLAASDPPTEIHQAERVACAPAQRLVERTGISGTAIMMTLVGAALGGSLGGSAVIAANWNQITPAGISVAVFSAAVLGGFFAFLASSFLWVAGRALREALHRDRQPGS